MSILDKIKLFFDGKPKEEFPLHKENLKIEELPIKLEDKIKEISSLKTQLKDEIDKRISNFNHEIVERISILESIDLSERKDEDRIKAIVNSNLIFYISNLKRMHKDLENIKGENIEDYVNKLSFILKEFNRLSWKYFEKATILIGEELGETKRIINSFIRDLNRLIGANKFIFEKSILCGETRQLLAESEQLGLLKIDIETNSLRIKNALQNTEKELIRLRDKKSEIQTSSDFKKSVSEKEAHKNKIEILEKDIGILKEALNLKKLLKEFHSDEKADRLLRNYLEDFKDAIREDKDFKIIGLLNRGAPLYELKLIEIRKQLEELSIPFIPQIDTEMALYQFGE